MNKKGKQLLGLLLAVLLVVSLVPISASALESGVEVRIEHYKMSNKIIGDQFNSQTGRQLKPESAATSGRLFTTSDSEEQSYSLYVPTNNMTDEEKKSYTLPYFVDDEDNQWYLYQVLLSNKKSTEEEEENTKTLISASSIRGFDSKADYTVRFQDITMDPAEEVILGVPGKYLYVQYCWTPYAPENWANIGAGPAKTYSVEYDLNLPEDTERIYPVMYDEDYDRNYISVTDGGTNEGVLLDEVGELKKEGISEGLYFKLAEGFNYVGFLAISQDGKTGWEFEGWQDETEETHDMAKDPSQPVKIQATSDLADGDKTIKFTGEWKKIEAKNDEELADAPTPLPLPARSEALSISALQTRG